LLSHEVFLTCLGLFLLVLAVTLGGYSAPLESVANPQVTPMDTEAPWYFWWLQGMLKLGDKTIMGIIIPTILVAVLVALPYIDRNPYRRLVKRPVAVAVGILAMLTLVMLSYMGLPQWGIEANPALHHSGRAGGGPGTG
jgi:quinol-cytochrome oxidoreductase complex cytochrome b subunit